MIDLKPIILKIDENIFKITLNYQTPEQILDFLTTKYNIIFNLCDNLKQIVSKLCPLITKDIHFNLRNNGYNILYMDDDLNLSENKIHGFEYFIIFKNNYDDVSLFLESLVKNYVKIIIEKNNSIIKESTMINCDLIDKNFLNNFIIENIYLDLIEDKFNFGGFHR